MNNRLKLERCLPLLCCLVLAACAQHPGAEGEQLQARITTRGYFTAVDGNKPASETEIALEPGKYVLEVRYETYWQDYLCRFDIDVTAGSHYEIISKPNPQPLTMYRLQQTHQLWVLRLDPVAPIACEAQRHRTGKPEADES